MRDKLSKLSQRWSLSTFDRGQPPKKNPLKILEYLNKDVINGIMDNLAKKKEQKLKEAEQKKL